MFDWFCEQQNITLFIAVIGCIISIYNFAKDFFQSLNRISVAYRNHTCDVTFSKKAKLTVGLVFSNISTKPVSITRMYFEYKRIQYEFAFPANTVWEFTTSNRGEIKKQKTVESQRLPFRIGGLGAVGGYFMVFLPSELESDFKKATTLKLLVYTNRGKNTFSVSAMNYGYDAEDYGYPCEN